MMNEHIEVPLMSDLSDTFISKLPESRRSAVHTAYANAPNYIVSIINRYCNKLSYIRNTKYRQDGFGNIILNKYGERDKETCHYSQDGKYIAMHENMTNAEYVDVIEHELGHFIDDALGRPSTDTIFSQAFENVVARYNPDTLDGKRLLNDMLDDAMSTGAAFDRNITDIISAITTNNTMVVQRFINENISKRYFHHGDDYWKRLNVNGMPDETGKKETFANLFAIETGGYRISVNFIERWFPELPIALQQCIERA